MIYINITFSDPCVCCWNFEESIKTERKIKHIPINNISNTKGGTNSS